MKTKYIVSVKCTGLSYNIIKLIILTDLAKKYNRKLVFLTRSDHIPILKKFNKDCMYIPCVPGHTDKFNNFIRQKQVHLIYDLNYKRFLKSTYIDNITTDNVKMGDIRYINGYNISDSLHNVLLVDYGKNMRYTANILHTIPHNKFNIEAKHHIFNGNIMSINVKIEDPNDSRVYELWDEIIPALKLKYDMPILLISGNNDIKKYLGNKHDCIYEIKETESIYLYKRNSETIKGIPYQVYDDLIICRSTHFIPLIKLRADFRYILSKYRDIKFIKGILDEKGSGIEHFDVLAHYLSIPIPRL